MAILTGSWKIDILTLLAIVIAALYCYAKRAYTYWDRKGLNYIPNASYLFGHFKRTFLQQENFAEQLDKLYRATSEPFVGIYSILKPVLLVRDPQLIRSVLVTDFTHFTDRGIHCNEEYDPLSANLLTLPGKKWRNLRGKLSPSFTSGKLKGMFPTLLKCGSTLQSYLDKISKNGKLLDVHEISASHSTDIIASVAFGIEVDTINNPNNEFRVNGRKIFELSLSNGFREIMGMIAPKVMSLLRIKSVDSDVENFIKSVVRQTLEHREKNNVVRKDFFQLLIQLRNTGSIQLDDEWDTVIKADESQKTLTFNEIAAQTFIFFAAGFETSSTTLTFCMYELAKSAEIQGRVHAEIDRVLAEHNGEITYDSISKMRYLDQCIAEILRMYPVAPILPRTCVKDYQIPGTNFIVEKGTEVFIPVFSLQRDEQFYKDPLKFDPDRFSDENMNGKSQISNPYLPFGDGPRNCVGMRQGKIQTKVGLIMMLQKYRFELKEKLKNREMGLNPKAFLLAPLGDIKLHVFKR